MDKVYDTIFCFPHKFEVFSWSFSFLHARDWSRGHGKYHHLSCSSQLILLQQEGCTLLLVRAWVDVRQNFKGSFTKFGEFWWWQEQKEVGLRKIEVLTKQWFSPWMSKPLLFARKRQEGAGMACLTVEDGRRDLLGSSVFFVCLAYGRV